MITLFVQSLLVETEDKNDTISSSNDEDEDADAVVGTGSSSTMTTTTVKGLCRGLARNCQQAKDPDLLDAAVDELRNKAQQQQQQLLASVFFELAGTHEKIAVTLIALGSGLDATQQHDWLSLLLQTTTTNLNDATQLALVRTFLQTSVTAEQWQQRVWPALKLKLKSHPDRALSTVLGWVQSVGGGGGGSTDSTAASADNDNIEPIILLDDEGMALLIKHVSTSAKDENRALASQILVQACCCRQPQQQQYSIKATNAIATALCTAKTTTTPAPARVSIYETLEQLAANRSSVDDYDDGEDAAVIGKVLVALVGMVQKEPKAEHRVAGLQALVEWLVLAKRRSKNNDNEAAAAATMTGYQTAFSELIQKPVIAKKAATAGGACTLLGLMVQRIHPDLLESMASDLWLPGNKTWEKGLESILAAASTKKSAQVDGLLVIYFALLFADQTSQPIPPYVSKIVAAGASTKHQQAAESSSFLYAPSMMDAVASNDIVSTVLPRVIALYTQLAAASKNNNNGGGETAALFSKTKISAATRALAVCALHPTTTTSATLATIRSSSSSVSQNMDHHAGTAAVLASIQKVLVYQPAAGDQLVEALFDQVQLASAGFESTVDELNASREAASEYTKLPASQVKSRGESGSHPGFDAGAVRRVARVLDRHCRDATAWARVLILMHAGSSLRDEGHQREALILNTTNAIREIIKTQQQQDGAVDTLWSGFRAALASEIARVTAASTGEDAKTSDDDDGAAAISATLHEAGLSLLTSLGGIASNFSPETDDPADADLQPFVFASRLCIQDIAPLLSSQLKTTLQRVEELSENDIDVYLSPAGTLVRNKDAPSSTGPVKAGGKRLSEEEEWELQMKKELAEKKKGSASSKTLSNEDQKLLAQQDVQRQQISSLLTVDFVRVLDSIRYLCSSDIEVGNECLTLVSESVLAAAASTCPAIKRIQTIEDKTFAALTALGTCVYEIHEDHAPTMATALLVSCRKEDRNTGVVPSAPQDDAKDSIKVSALPSPCAPAACVIYEMDSFHDCLSGASFSFLFPIIHAALMGPRTTAGCESALRVLERHTELLSGDSRDPAVVGLRKDMVVSVLELLKYDRAQTFQDPTPLETLVSCFRTDETSTDGPALSTAELAPLLDERGALGTKNCRIGSMLALTRIAADHRTLVKANLLVENRIWLNCFEKDEDIRSRAWEAWSTVNGLTDVFAEASDLPAPSPLYGAPLLPLLSHSDPSIAQCAADSFAHAMGMHSGSVSRNIEVLCKTYIDSFPTNGVNDDGKSMLPLPAKPAAAATIPAKKKIATGLPKKKSTGKKSALDVAGIGKPKTTKKKASHSALLKPKQERTLDQAALESQFLTAGTKAVEKEKDSPAKITVRLGVLRAMAALSGSSIKVDMDEATLKLLTSFLMAYGIADGEDSVKGAARNTLRDVVASNGDSEEAIAFLLPHLEAVLKTGVADEGSLGSLSTTKVPKDSDSSDRRKEGAVVALGSVALHLKGTENDEKVENTIDMLISALKTPSEEVQQSVADALTKLMKKGRTQDRIESILSGLLKDCLDGGSSAIRRGAAHGLSAAVKGSGITTLKKYEIVKQLEEACASGGPSAKEGSLFAIELLSSRLGLLFEPYVIVLLPSLLKAFSDSSDHVRKAANNTASLIMSKLSAHGVKLVMPAVLTAFDDPAWRTKQASIHMLGAMSHLAPKQLASALPKVVPQLTEAFSDTHTKVKASAQEALNEISTVVKNPEISSISPILLKALTDPADNTIKALEALIATEFLHAIDAPSLSLIVPILHRGLRDRGATTKRFSGLIAGNICTMINDPKDLVPYLPTLLPDLQTSLLDPIPDVRSTSAQALGSLTRSLGDHILLELRPWLITTLRDGQASSAERSGAAQGLTEVLIASGSAMVEDTMRREILPLRSYPEASTREGVLWMLTFLPPVMGQGFTPLIDVSLPALINGLSDDSEPVRDVALRAGRVLIRSHGKVHVDKILPSLEAGLSDDDHRIRVASLSLLGDLLSMIGGTQVLKGEGDTQDDIRRAERAQAQIALVLGSETRKRVLSGLYLARCDSVHMVRQSAIQVWKTVVSVTARALREILGVLVNRIITDLASGHDDKTEVAGRCLGDLVSKLGDSVLPQIIPVLRNSLYEGDEDTRRGVCVGLTEVIKCSTKDQILRFIEVSVPPSKAFAERMAIVRTMWSVDDRILMFCSFFFCARSLSKSSKMRCPTKTRQFVRWRLLVSKVCTPLLGVKRWTKLFLP